MPKTNKEVKMNWREYGEITIPAGQRVSPADHGQYFVEDLDKLFPSGSFYRHDAEHYGIRINAEDVVVTLQEQHDAKRKQYVMENKLTHAEFYHWLGQEIGITVSDLPVSVEQVRQSKDEHLNDIPLKLWDGQDYIVRGKAVRAGMRAWSLSDTVCVLKQFAREAASTVSK